MQSNMPPSSRRSDARGIELFGLKNLEVHFQNATNADESLWLFEKGKTKQVKEIGDEEKLGLLEPPRPAMVPFSVL